MAEANVVVNNSVQAGTSHELELIDRVQRGENSLFYELVRPYERRVFAAAMAILRNESDAEDVAQEAMLKALRAIRQFRADARFSTWLIQITVNEALMRRRKDRNHGQHRPTADHRVGQSQLSHLFAGLYRQIPRLDSII